MANMEQAQQAIIDRIAALAPKASSEANGRAILDLAEAYAWLRFPNQPHGANVVAKSS